MVQNNNETKKYRDSFALYPTNSGNGAKVTLGAKDIALMKTLKEGDNLFLGEVSSEQREKIELGGKTAPVYRLVVFIKESREQQTKRTSVSDRKVSSPSSNGANSSKKAVVASDIDL